MSGFDSNPFADPFTDRDVTEARSRSGVADSIENFNPFEHDQFATQRPSAVLQTSAEPPPYSASATAPSASTTAAVAAATDDLRRRQEELDRKALELERREQDMQRTNDHLARTNNFPPMPAFCPVRPCFYQDFALDIPAEFQRTVRIFFYVWIVYCAVLFINIFGSLTYFIVSMSSNQCGGEGGTTFGLSILYFFLWVPCSYIFWFRPIYNAFRSDSSFYFFVFFVIFFLQCCTCVIQCIGIQGSGTVGYISGLGLISCNVGAAAFLLTIGALFTLLAVICFSLLFRVHRHYRSSGASFSKAQQEFAQGIVSNTTVRQTASGFASVAVQDAVNQYTGGTDNRY